MKKNDKPIPLQSVVYLPRWLMLGGVALSGACIAGGIVLAIVGLCTASGGALGGYLGGAVGCIVGGAGGLFGTLADWRRRLPATALFGYLKQDAPPPFYRRVFWPSLAVMLLGIALGLVWNHRAIWHGLVQTGAMLAFCSGTIEAVRRHGHRRARAVFSLYADGALDAADAAAIDDARAKDARFDAEVLEFQRVSEALRDLTRA
ncbi:MAG TPA: hypothetical protein VFZ65_23610 [Planctomycetota bacterium]|nr:hypothetical protein [Planctomycetota bacterium]